MALIKGLEGTWLYRALRDLEGTWLYRALKDLEGPMALIKGLD